MPKLLVRPKKVLVRPEMKKLLRPVKSPVEGPSPWFHVHAHSQFSVLDGMTDVDLMVRKAAKMGQPGLALMDHGNMAGVTRLYKASMEYGIKPFPGIETYLIDPNSDDPMDAKSKRFHVGLFALTYRGYQGLVRLSSLAHTRPRFSRFPRLLMADLAEFGEAYGKDVVLTTGCYFGLVQQQIDEDDFSAAERTIKSYAMYFPRTIVELQNHNITHDEGSGKDDTEMVETLYRMAVRNGLPVVATQDSHYLDQRQKVAHGLMKRMVYGGEEYSEFPGDSFHLASADWVQGHYSRPIWADVEDTCRWLIAHNKVHIPALDKFQAHVPSMSKTPDRELAQMCRDLLAEMLDSMDMSAAKRKKYVDRLEEELSVIKHVGMANYFLLWKQFVDWCNDERICIEARGSANGSLVCYLQGITQVDPIYWNTMFERFMSRDRIKPPDIDMDIESDRRAECVNWWRQRFTIVPIGNWSTLGSTNDGEDKGSVLVTYLGYLRRKAEKKAMDYWQDQDVLAELEAAGAGSAEISKAKNVFRINPQTGKRMTKAEVIDYGKRIFSKRYGHVKTIEDVRSIDQKDYEGLRELAVMASVYKSYGVHAAGILLSSPSLPIEDNIPTMLVASSDTIVTQFDMDDVEHWGLLKNDLLGQAVLTVMRRCQEMINDTYGDIEDPCDFSWIPYNDKDACWILREGRENNGIFHFEGYTKAKGGKEMRIASTKDVVMATALYMPGATESGQKDHYLSHRSNRTKNQSQRYPHQAYADVLGETYGAVIFQEQPMEILTRLGMSVANINMLFKVVKDSGKGAVGRNVDRIATLKKEFDYLCVKNGVEDVDHAWHLVTGFINYGFNRAHATGYGLRSYRCAYLKAHYPHEFMAALLEVWAERKNKNDRGQTKEDLYAREARRMDIHLLPPHVNESGATWTLSRRSNGDPKGIRKGLVSIKGMGAGSAAEIAAKAPYRSIHDLISRCSARSVTGGAAYLKTGTLTGKLAALAAAGALDDLSGDYLQPGEKTPRKLG